MMWLVFLFVSLSLIAPTDVLAEQRYLSGQVLHKQDTGRDKPIKGAVISIVKVGNPYATGEDGVYRVVVPDAIQPGETIKLHVKKIGWEIDKPEGGKFELPRDLAKDVFILPESSSEFLSDHHIDEFLESLPELTKAQIKPDEHREDVDPTLPVKEYATQHGLSYEATLSAVQKRIRFYEERGNPNQQCLAAVYRKDLERISTLCKPKRTDKIQELGRKRQEVEKLSKGGVSSLEKRDHRLRILTLGTTSVATNKLIVGSETPKSKQSKLYETKRELVQLIEEVVGDFRLAGDAYYINYDFSKALRAYQQGLEQVSKEEVPTLWADMQILIGNANNDVAIRSEGPSIHEYQKAAFTAYQKSLTVYTKTDFPQAWTGVQNNLGNTLQNQGIRSGGEEGRRLLAQAVTAYQAALEIVTRELTPQQWAMTQNNLGNTLQNQGIRSGGEEGRRLLAQAVAAYQAALQIYTRVLLPQQWATTQNNLGNTLQNQGIRTGGEEGRQLLAQAVAAHRAALEIRTRALFPQDWATTQNNLGVALSQQGLQTSGEEGHQLFAQAVAAYRAALEVQIRNLFPQDWAVTQNNLGNVLQKQGTRTDGDEGKKLIQQAIEAYESALEVMTKEALPVQWEQTLRNLREAREALADK